jgi:ATP-dependent RNA helicase DDX56/DBP9
MAKRKLDEHDRPAVMESEDALAIAPNSSTTTTTSKPSAAPPPASFSSLGLEPRLLRAIRDQKWASPTAIQSAAIPHALQGRDILARSGTGTGKTGAYMLPLLHNTLQRKGHTTLILAPTKELCQQLYRVARSLTIHCASEIRVKNIADKSSDAATKAALADKPEIVIATPARAWANINSGALDLSASLSALVVDEADLTIAYGSQSDLQSISENIPSGVQKILVSATLNTEVEGLSLLLCSDPIVLKLDDLEKNSQKVKQYVLKVAEEEKCKQRPRIIEVVLN